MADIRDQLKQRYDIDIKETNLLKIYKITDVNISDQDLEAIFTQRRKKWEQSINGANERFAQRDKAYLEKADVYESILRDSKVRKELFVFYDGKSKTKAEGDSDVSALVKRYFSLISKTTKIGNGEVDFFLKYFPNEKKNKKSILAFLKSEYKVLTTPLGGKESPEEEETPEEEEQSHRKKSNIITNLFAEKTMLKIRQCELNFLKSREFSAVSDKYPNINKSLYEFLGIGAYKNLEDFKKLVTEKRAEVYDVRNDFGTDFIPLVDLFNGLISVLEYNDIRDNFEEFKLLIMYPALTPYMYEIREIKKDGLDQLYQVASEEYGFRSCVDFLISYFNVIYDNFGICEDGIKKIMANAQKQAGKEKVLGAISGFFGIKKGKKMPAQARIVFAFAYWPIYLLACIFGFIKFAVEKMRYIGVAAGVAYPLGAFGYFVMQYGGFGFFSNMVPWIPFASSILGCKIEGLIGVIFGSIGVFLIFALVFIIPGVLVGCFLWKMSIMLRKRVDFIGIQRTIRATIEAAKQRTIEQYEDNPKSIFRKKLPLILVNLVVLGLFAGLFFVLKMSL